MNKFFGAILLSAVSIAFLGCDSTTSPRSLLDDAPGVSNLSVSPAIVSFTENADGFKDTTITLKLQFDVQNLASTDVLQYNISTKPKDRFPVKTGASGQLKMGETGSFSTSQPVQFRTTTTNIWDYVVNVFVNDSSGYGNYAQTELRVNGFSSAPPKILSAENESEFQRPESGSKKAYFKATVIDVDGDSTIYGVFLRLISRRTGEASNSPFELFDDGDTYDDSAKNDSVYTINFPIYSGNRPETYDILYFAIDNAGMVSDTARTTFTIVE
ncbi:hypothetical protein [Gracilimonas mengyeensis]|uniref:DUF4625 domain-containing protein n=1 Tax=Gracilimonas mengyeensis TaxID=1302730 RepID=A0A521AGZ3_9BACT|nr:hypothetical protein [Gracilimonas mengyeensis]SMO34008.1 hypothetical protein SAMN06265219_101124 [Gracilimonas mengyeensis]